MWKGYKHNHQSCNAGSQIRWIRQAPSSLIENCQLDKGSNNIPTPRALLTEPFATHPWIVAGCMQGIKLDVKPSAFLSASMAWWRSMLLTLAIKIFQPLLSLLLSTTLQPQGVHPLYELYQRMNLSVNLATYRACFCKSNRIYFLDKKN